MRISWLTTGSLTFLRKLSTPARSFRHRDLPPKINHLTITSRRPESLERHQNSTKRMGGDVMNRPRCADDFATIRARMQELRREREAKQAPQSDLPQDPPMRSTRY